MLLNRFCQIVLLLAVIKCTFADPTMDNIKKKLKVSLPEVKIDQIAPSVVPNVYQVISGRKVFYVDSTGNYLFLGNLIDLTTKKSLTEAKVQELSVVNISELPLNIAIRKVIGNGKTTLVIFTDPDCPFCKSLEQETISKLDNVTIYYFLYPLPIHQDAVTNSKKILCAENPDAMFEQYMNKNVQLPKRIECKNEKNLEVMIKLGEKYGVDATPTIVLPNGKLISGLVPADYLAKLIRDVNQFNVKDISESSAK